MNDPSKTPEASLMPYIPAKSLRQWRQSGDLLEAEHWGKEGREIYYTPAGMARIREELAPGVLPDGELAPVVKVESPVAAALSAVVRGASANPKYLRALVRLPSGGVLASVRLLSPQAVAARFRVGAVIAVLPDERLAGQFCTGEVKA